MQSRQNPNHYHKIDHHDDPIIDKGLLTLINQKLENGTSFLEIRSMLERAGISKIQMERALLYTAKYNQEAQHSEIEANDFLPPLSGIKRIPINRIGNKKAHIEEESVPTREQYFEKVLDSEIRHHGLFSGRLRRQEFVIGFLFFFGLGFIMCSFAVYLMQTFTPTFWQSIRDLIDHDVPGLWLMFIPFILAPITIMMLSLMTRRLHNIGLPGWFAWLFLIFFLPGANVFNNSTPIIEYSFMTVYALLAVLFLALIVKKGHRTVNRHGPLPRSEGSIFKKIFGNDILETITT